jgi:hypothetical protein
MTTDSIALGLLKCLRCGALVPAQEDEVAWVCAQCGQGLQLGPASLAPLSINWAAGRAGPDAARLRWAPFWAFVGAVTFNRRESYHGRRPPEKLWAAPVRFYVPAFTAPLRQMADLGADLTRRQIRPKAGPPQGLLSGCTLSLDDAAQAADFIVLTIEAAQSDKLKSVDFSLKLSQPELWMLPFAGEPQPQSLALLS